MKSKKAFSVFVSSTQVDLQVERAKMFKALLEDGHIPQAMEYFPSSSEETVELIHSFLDKCDILISISQARYGSIEPRSGLSFTELEWDYAKSKGIPCIPFISGDIGNGAINKSDPNLDMMEKIKRFQAKMGQQNARRFTNPDELASLVKSAVNSEIANNGHSLTGWVRRDISAMSQFPEGAWRLKETSRRDWNVDGITRLKIYSKGLYHVFWVNNQTKSATTCLVGSYSLEGGYYSDFNIIETPKYGGNGFLSVVGKEVVLNIEEQRDDYMKCNITIDNQHQMSEVWEQVDDF